MIPYLRLKRSLCLKGGAESEAETGATRAQRVAVSERDPGSFGGLETRGDLGPVTESPGKWQDPKEGK